jgi:site-specific DNA recombinase
MAGTNKRASDLVTALIYTRVSTEEQARGGVSLDTQLKECRGYAAAYGWAIGAEYQDVLSGKRDDRPQYQALLADVRRRRTDGQSLVVVVWRLDRLGRRVLERIRCREELKWLGVATHSVKESGELPDLVANMLAVMAEEEVRIFSERVSAAKQHIKHSGWHPTGRVPWGYRNRPATPEERLQGAPAVVLDVDPVTLPFALEAFHRIAAGQSITKVAQWAANLPAEARGGRIFSVTSMTRTLTSPTMLGRVTPDGPPAHWPPLVDRELWDRVQARLLRHKFMPRQATQRFLLTGLVRCERCGGRMSGWAHYDPRRPRERQRVQCSYVCNGLPTNRCGMLAQPASQIEGQVLAEVASLLEGLGATDEMLRAALRRAWARLQAPADPSPTVARRKSLEQQAAKARQRLTRAAVLYADGDIDKAGYELLRDQAATDLEAAEAALGQLQPDAPAVGLPSLDQVLRDVGGWSKALASPDIEAQRDVLAELVERVVPVRLGRGQYRAEVTWTSLATTLREALAVAANAA